VSTQFHVTTVVLSEPELRWLDRTRLTVLTNGRCINRSVLLRGLCRGLAAGRVDLSNCCSEEEVARAIKRQVTNGTNGKHKGAAR